MCRHFFYTAHSSGALELTHLTFSKPPSPLIHRLLVENSATHCRILETLLTKGPWLSSVQPPVPQPRDTVGPPPPVARDLKPKAPNKEQCEYMGFIFFVPFFPACHPISLLSLSLLSIPPFPPSFFSLLPLSYFPFTSSLPHISFPFSSLSFSYSTGQKF